MANVKISDLPSASSVGDSDSLVLNQSGTTKIAAKSVLLTGYATLTGSETLTNKTIAFASNTLTGVQPTLVSGTNIKTINSQSLLGSGDLSISGSEIVRVARTSNTILGPSNRGNLIDITSGTFTQTFDACATLGSGWFCYIRNSGTGDITLDPDAGETIDGLTSYIMYPGEVRLVQCDGSTLRTVVLQGFYRVFTATGTFTKPPGYSAFQGFLWSGGASGDKGSGRGRGGGGGGCGPFTFAPSSLGATETVTIGAGGLAVTTASTDGNPGGNSSFSFLTVIGGGSLNNVNGGTIARSGARIDSTSYDGYGAASANTNSAFNSVWGGGTSRNAAAATAGGSSVWGGGSGGGTDGVSSAAGGASVFGGNGGSSGVSTNGVDGAAPGGGGGATSTGTQSGAGARGEVRIWGIV